MFEIWLKIKRYIRQNIRMLLSYIGNLRFDDNTLSLYYKKYIRKIKAIKKQAHKAKHNKNLKQSFSWRLVFLIGLPTFFVCYYLLGAALTENMRTDTEYTLRENKVPTPEIALVMSFLLKQEIDDKVWTPNLPPIFPAYILDNMPNFQIGVVNAVKDVATVLKKFDQNTIAQKAEIKRACQYLQYSPYIWLMTKKGKFNLAPSANAQYRKAAVELQSFGKDGVYYPDTKDLDSLLLKISYGLQKLATNNETHYSEHATDRIDTKADDLFYYVKGYTYAMWQISKVIGADYKEIILQANAYTEWTYLTGSLKRAAALKPLIVRNGEAESILAPNHLLGQNYYLLRATTAVEKIRNKIKEK
ncbi:MAG: DUF2333 family protein [Alphaproteobacteria bacterium]|nr:DUF2333 family protein [Alphaproteobacteria bacterium]